MQSHERQGPNLGESWEVKGSGAVPAKQLSTLWTCMRAPSIAGKASYRLGCLLEALLREIPKEPPLGLVAMENEDSGPPFPLGGRASLRGQQ